MQPTLPLTRPTPQPQPRTRPFPREISNQLDGVDLRLLEEVTYLSRQTAKRSRTGARYSYASEEYFAEKIGITRARLSNHVCKLEKLGILKVTRRGSKGGKWQTNLLQVINWCWWRLTALFARSPRKKPRACAATSTQTLPKREKEEPEGTKGSPSGSIPDLRQCLQQYAPALLAKIYPNR